MTEMILTAVRGVQVAAAEGDDDTAKRTVSGLAVQYGVVGRVSNGWLVRFEPGSLGDPETVKLRRDHEYPIGVVTEWDDSDEGRSITARISEFPRGDEALTLAKDGVLDSFSVGVIPVEYSFEASEEHGGEEVLVVHKGDWRETSLVEFGAFPGAKVTKVAASAAFPSPRRAPDAASNPPTKEAPVPDTQTPEVEAIKAEAPESTTVDFTALGEAIAAGLKPTLDRIVEAAEKPATIVPEPTVQAGAKFKNVGDFAFAFLRAQKGEEAAKARIEAALKSVLTPELGVEAALSATTTALNTGLIPPVYTSEILGGLPVSTPILDLLVRHSQLPATGMSMIKPEWVTLPEGDWVNTENTEPASDAVAIGTTSVSVLTWAHAIKASVNLLERATFGGFAQAYYEQVVLSFRSDLEAKTREQIYVAAPTYSPADITKPVDVIADLVEEVIAQQSDSNGNFRGLPPDFVAVAPNQFGRLIKTTNFMPFAQTSASWGSMMGSLAGLTVVMVPSLPPGDIVVGARGATVVYDDTPAELRAVIVNTMSIELGVIVNTAVHVEFPDALAKVTFGS